MNKIYRIVWNKARQCLLVVGENARTTVKSSGTAKTDAGFRVSLWRRALIDVLILLQVVCPPFAAAQTVIKPDGRTQTTVVNSGPVYNVSTATVTGNNAFNSFSAFSVGAGNTANLHIPSSAINLVNIVRDQRTDISGILNAIKDGRIGGNVWFANPHGFIVGASGVVNVGSLTVTTPTQNFVDNFFTAPGSPDQSSVTQLLSGTAPRNSAGLISIMGRINAAEGIELSAGAVNVAGSIYSGARFVGTAPDFTDVVNANGLASATNVIVREGRIQIVADNDVTVSGSIAAPGGAGVRGGDISLRAGGNVELNDGAMVSARGNGANSAGGTVNIWGDNNASFYHGAVIDASAGSSGDGGAIELSARNNIDLAGGEFRADVFSGARGSILIDPSSITVSGNILRGALGYGTLPLGVSATGADLTLAADDSITVNSNIVVSSRSVASDHIGGASTANSGNITLTAPDITLKSGAKVLANADSGFTGGTVTMTATSNSTLDILGYKEAQSHIRIGEDAGGATIKGKSVVLHASATADNSFLFPASATDNTISVVTKSLDTVASLAPLALGINAVYSQAKAVADVSVKNGSLIEVDGSADLRAETTSGAGARPLNFLKVLIPLKVDTPVAIGALYARIDATASVQVDSGATIKASDLSVRAHNNAKLDASIDATPKDKSNASSQTVSVAVGFTEADIQSRASVGGTLDVSGKVQVVATNEGSYSNAVTSRTASNGRAAAAVAISNHVSGATAELNANVRDATKVSVVAINDITKDATTSQTTTGTTPITEIVDKLKSNVANGIQEQLFNYLKLDLLKPKTPAANPDAPTQVKFRLAGALAYADSVANASASIGGAASVHASDSVSVVARVNAQDIKNSAESSATSNSSQSSSNSDTSRQAYSAGVAIGSYEHNALAEVGANVNITAPRIGIYSDTRIPIRDSLLFGNTAPFDRWLGLSNITGAIESITNVFDVFNGVSAAKAKSDESEGSIALSGSASFLKFKNTSRAVVDTGAKLNLSGSTVGAWTTDNFQLADAVAAKTLFGVEYEAAKVAKTMNFAFDAPAQVKATHDATLLFLGGPVIPTGSAEKGLGMALNDIDVTSRTEAVVREGVVIQGVDETAGAGAPGSRTWTLGAAHAAPEVRVTSSNQDKVISLVASSGLGATFGVNGSVSILTVDASSRASMDDEASVNTKKLEVDATSSPVLWSLAGGINLSKGASVGVGIAVNDLTGVTRADVSDNDTYSTSSSTRGSALTLTPYSATNTTGVKISAPVVDVTAHTSGRVEAIAVTGAVANQTDDEGGFLDNIKGKYDNLVAKTNALVGLNPKAVTKSGGSSTSGTPQKPKFGLSAAGSAAVNTTDVQTAALIAGVYIDQARPTAYTGAQSLVVRGISDSDITTASGAAAVTRANSSTQSSATGIAGSVAVNQIGNGNEAELRDSTVVNADDVTVQALSGGEQLSVAIGAAVDASKGANIRNKTSIVGSLSLTLAQTDETTGKTKNYTDASIENSTISGDATATGRVVDVTAYNRTFIGTGGGSLSVQATGGTGKGTSIGGAVTYSDIRNDVDSHIAHSMVNAVDSVGVKAYNATEIGAGAAMGGVSAVQKSNSIAGAFVITEVTNHTTAAITGSNITASGAVSVLANDQGADSALETLIDPENKRSNTVAGLDYCGRDAGAGLSPTGNCIASVAGVLQLTRGNNVGASASYNLIENHLTAQVENTVLNVTGTGGKIDIKANSSADIIGLALGVGASQKFSGAGSISIAEIHNTVTASASRSTIAPETTSLSAGTISIEAKDGSSIKTVGGQVVVSTQQSAVGAAVTYNDIANTVSANADGATLSANTSVKLASENNSKIQSLAVAGGLANKVAVSASLSLNFIKNSTISHSSATFDDRDGGANTNTVAVTADDTSTIESLAGSVAIGKKAGAGGAFAWNQIDNKVGAALEGAVVHRAASFDVLANETSKIHSLSGAASGGQTLAFSGSVSINHVGQSGNTGDPDEDGNVTSAEVKNTTFDGAAVAANVKAKDKTEIKSLAGAVAVSLGTAAVGGAVADNAIRNVAKASVSGSTLANAASLAVEGKNESTIDSLSAAAAGAATGAAAGSASSNRTSNRTIGELVDSAITGASANASISGLDTAIIRSLSGGAAISGSGGVGAAVSVNKINNTTDARVSGKKAASNGYEVADLVVKGDSFASIQTLAVGLGAGVDVGVAGSAAINLIGSNTRAHIDGGATVKASGSVGVVAESDDKIEVAAGAAGIGATAAGVAASTAVNRITGTTEAYIAGATTEVDARANTGTGVVVDTGSLNGTVDLAGIVGGSTTSINLAGMRQNQTIKGLAVNASATHQVRTTAVNIAAGFYAGVGATANVNVIGGNTRAYIDSALINGGDNSSAGLTQQVQVKASDHAYANTFIGGVSGGLAGVGAAADVNVFSRNTLASVVGSNVHAKGRTEVGAWSTQGVSSLVVGLGAGGFAAVGTGVMAKFTSQTEAWTDGATLDTGTLDISADHDTHMFLSAGAVALGGSAVAGTFAVGLDNSVIKAHIDGGSVDASGQIDVKADSSTELKNIGVSGAGAGGVSVAGMAVVALIGNTTQAYTTGTRIGSAGTPSGGLAVTAKDMVSVDNKAGAAAGGGSAGIGLGAGVTKVANTVSAYVADSNVDVVNDVVVDAAATRDLYTFAATAGVSAGFSLAGAAGITIVGSTLSSEAKNELGSSTDSELDRFASKDRLSVGGNIDTNSNFTQSDIDAINSAGKTSTSSNLATSGLAPGTLAQRTKAQISGSASNHVQAGKNVLVHASEKDKVAMQVGSVSVGVVALGGSVGFLDITNNVESEVSGAVKLTSTSGKIDVTSDVGRLDAAQIAASVQTLQGSGGVVGLGAAVSKVTVTNNVAATIGRGTTTESLTGDIMVKAVDSSDLDAEAIGLNVGLVGAGVTLAYAEKKGSTTASIGDEAASGAATQVTLDNDTLRVQADRSGRVKAKATAGAGGILSGSGADARATDGGLVQALVGNSVEVDSTGGKVEVSATATPQTDASALGINIGAGSVGASLATARSNATVAAKLGAGTDITAAILDVLATRNIGAAPSALAKATGASGGLLFGINATVAKAESTGTSSALVGDNSTLTVSGMATIKADSNSQQTSSGEGFSAGFIAVGADYSYANSDTLTQAVLGDGVKATGGTLQVLAESADANYAYGLAGSGGLASAPFSEASTSNTSRTYARTGGGNNTIGNARKIDVSSLLVSASHDAHFDSWIDSTNASLIGVSGAKASNTVNSQSEAHIGTSGYVEADNITLRAHNDVFKLAPDSGTIPGLVNSNDEPLAVPGWNVYSSSGGLADVPAAGSISTINSSALVQVGAGAHLEQTGDASMPGVFFIDAWNSITAADKVKMSSGGAVSAASGRSEIVVADCTEVNGVRCARIEPIKATVRVGDFSELTSLGDMAIGAYTNADVSTQTAVDVYGLVGVAPEGASVSLVRAANTVDIGATADLSSADDIRLSAGSSSVDKLSHLVAEARTDVFNNTAIPVSRDPVADAVIESHSQINVGAGAKIKAAGHIKLYADEGDVTATGVGIGKDIYREALAAIASAISNAFGGGDVSFETRTGRSVKTLSSDVKVDGEVHVGTNRKQELIIGLDGTVTSSKGDISIIDTSFKDVAADIQERINTLNKLIADYKVDDASGTTDASVAVAAYKSEIAFLKRKLIELGFASGEVATSPDPKFTQLKAAQDSVTGMTTLKTNYSTTKTTKTTENTNLTTANTNLTTANTNLTTANTNLTTQNGTLTTQNGTLTTQNGTLTTQNATLQALINALPADDPGRVPLQNQINTNNATIASNNNTITSNNNTITSNNNTITSNSNTITSNNNTINDNNNTMALNTTQIEDLTTKISSLETQIDNVNRDIAASKYPDTPAYGPSVPFLTISDARARLGNIYVRGDRLHGGGTLDAPGDAAITIENRGPSFLLLRNLEIPAELGGKLYVNGVSVKDNAGINNVNGAAGGAAFNVTTAESTGSTPTIQITSLYNPLNDSPPAGTPDVAPDMIFQGDISNPRGTVIIHSEAGSIRLEQKRDAKGVLIEPVETATIRANDVEIVTKNGDFVQSYTNTFFHTAGAPLTVTPGDPELTPDSNPDRFSTINRTAEGTAKGIVANGSVLIAARYLNINGIIQSGIAEWGVNVPADATVSIPGNPTASFAQAIAFYNALSDADKAKPDAELFKVGNASVTGLDAATQGGWEKIDVRFNARQNRLELGGVQVQGGYIELFGQIFNTNLHESTSMADLAGGQLRVLDGYGKINVSNLTNMPLWINTLDTGRGARGEINISNIVGIADGSDPRIPEGTAIIATQQFTRDPGDARSGEYYTPTSGLRYAMSVGRKAGWTDNYRYSAGAIIGIEAFPTQLDQYWISRSYSVDDPIKSNGEFLGFLDPLNHNGDYTKGVTQTKTTSSNPVQTASWFECNWWTLCAYGTYYKEFSIDSMSKSVTTDSVKADNPIAVKFIGFDNGEVKVNSTGNVVINGPVNNRKGDTTIKTVGAITQASEIGTVGGTTVTLEAGSGIGSATRAVQVDTADTGRLNATSTTGDVRVKEMLGDMRVGSIGGVEVSTVTLEADRSIVNVDASSYVQGKRVELSSNNGSIGTAGDALKVRTGYSSNVSDWSTLGLKATARDDINIINEADAGNVAYSGNLLLISAESLAGNVLIETAGSAIDNNPFATTDTRTETALAALWDDLRLRGDPSVAKANEAVDAYKAGKNVNYALYWKMRSSQANGGMAYSPDYRLTSAERSALAKSGMSTAQIDQFELNRRTQYQQLHTEVGGLTATYVAGYDYAVSASEGAQIRKGATWSDTQLALSVGAGLLKNITDTVTTIKQPNAKARGSVTLIAHDNIGSYNAPQVIDLSAGLAALTTAQKAALAAAERGDATLDKLVNPTKITIVQPRPVNIEVLTGALKATATSGYALIGSEQDLRIDQVSAATDIRIKTAGSLINAASVPGASNVVGNNVILEAAVGGIGSLPVNIDGDVSTPMRVDAAGNVIARASNDIWIEAPNHLGVDTVYSPTDVTLSAHGSILDAHTAESTVTPEINVRARNIDLSAIGGSIGTLTNELDVGVNRDGAVSASSATLGKGVYLNGPSGEYFNIDSITSGDAVTLRSATDMKIDGLVTGPGPFTLSAGSTILMTPTADLHATTLGVFLRAKKDLVMQDAQFMLDNVMTPDPKYVASDAARMRVDVGTIDIETVGDALITGIETGNGTESAIRVVSTAGRILDNGDTRLDIIADTGPAAKLTISGAKGIGDNQLDTRLLNLQATSGGVVDIDVQNGVNIIGISAGDRVMLTAGGDITGESVTSTGTGETNPDKSVLITSATGGVYLASVSGTSDVAVSGQTGVALDGLSSTGGSIAASSAGGNVEVGRTTAERNVTFSAPTGSVSADSSAAGGTFTASAARSVDVGTVTANSVVLSAKDNITADTLNLGSSLQLAGSIIDARVNGGANPITGSVTGIGGAPANSVNLILSGPGGFDFVNFIARTASVNIPLGTFSIDNAIILDRATFTNLQTRVLVDQHDKSIQRADIQLYTGGDPFSLYLKDNSLTTDSFVINRSALHEVITANGTNTSVVEQGQNELALADRSRSNNPDDEEGKLSETLLSYEGVPVSFECPSDNDPECLQ